MELQHHGVKGMRWGVRRFQNEDGSLTPRGEKRYALKGYTQDSYNSNKTAVGRAYDRFTGAHKYGGDMMYDAASKSERKARAEKYVADQNRAKANKQKVKATAKKLNKEAGLGEKLMYNNSTRKLAAKYIVNNNMSVSDAKRKAAGVANRNTAIFVAAYGAVTLASLYATKNM